VSCDHLILEESKCLGFGVAIIGTDKQMVIDDVCYNPPISVWYLTSVHTVTSMTDTTVVPLRGLLRASMIHSRSSGFVTVHSDW
tara:strand:+ start:1129 stop:1380 length:252 start_codon:yes stop_codon:yes gene_type:complete